MNVLVDTPIWSAALRRRAASPKHAHALTQLIAASRTRIIGPIRQELLSGIAHRPTFEQIRDHLRLFPDIPLLQEDHERAAEFYNLCRARGLQGSHTDFLICAVADRLSLGLYTDDADFSNYARHIPLLFFIP
jgi:predicted nucleic acid-binding protein